MPKAYRATSGYMLKKAKPVEIKKPTPQTRPLYKYEQEKNQALIDSLFQKYRKKVELTAPIANTQAPTSVFQKAVPEVSQRNLTKGITKKIYQYQKEAEKRREELRILQVQRLISGYEVWGDPDQKMCEVCESHHGEFYEVSDTSPMPPFHPNCRCEAVPIWLDVPYDPETGLIGRGATREIITKLLSKALQQYGLEGTLTWGEIMSYGVYDPKTEVTNRDTNIDPKDLVGWTTYLDTTRVTNADLGMETYFRQAKEDGLNIKDSYDKEVPGIRDVSRLIVYANLVRYDSKYDLKTKTDTIFGIKDISGKDPQYWAFVFDGKLIRNDAPGNIMAGYLAYYCGISLGEVLLGAQGESLALGAKLDDATDQEYIKIGYQYAEAEDV